MITTSPEHLVRRVKKSLTNEQEFDVILKTTRNKQAKVMWKIRLWRCLAERVK